MYTKEEIWTELCRLCSEYDAACSPDEQPPLFSFDATRPISPEEEIWFKRQKLPGRYEGSYFSIGHTRLSFEGTMTALTESSPTAKSVRLIPKPHSMHDAPRSLS